MTVNVNAVVLTPSAVSEVGPALKVELVLLGAPLTKRTAAVLLSDPIAAVSVFASALVEASVVLKAPEASVVPVATPKALFVPVLLKDTL